MMSFLNTKESLFFRYFNKLDFLSQEFGFEMNNSNRYKNTQGAVFSFIAFITIFVIALLFGIEVVERKSPSVTVSEEFSDDIKLKISELPFMFSIWDNNGKYIPGFMNYFDYTINLLYADKNGYISIYNDLYLKNCSEIEYNAEYSTSISKLRDIERYCIYSDNKTHYLWNTFGTHNSSMLKVQFYVCDQITNPNCLINESNKYIPNFAIQYFDFIINSANYDKPITSFIASKIFSLKRGVTKIFQFIFQQNKYLSDDGWLLESMREIQFVSFRSYDLDIVFQETDKKFIGAFRIEAIKTERSIKRSYLKIQELFAKIGGIANAIIIISSVLSYHYLRYKYLVFIWAHSFLYLRDSNSGLKLQTNIINNPYTDIANNSNINNDAFINSKSAISRFNYSNKETNLKSSSDHNMNDKRENNSFNLNNYKNNDNSKEEYAVIDNKICNNSNIKINKSISKNCLDSSSKVNVVKLQNNILNNNLNNNINNLNDCIKLKNNKEKKNDDKSYYDNKFNITEVNYFEYIRYLFCFNSCCSKLGIISKEDIIRKDFYLNEINRVKKLLDIRIFKNFLILGYFKETNDDKTQNNLLLKDSVFNE